MKNMKTRAAYFQDPDDPGRVVAMERTTAEVNGREVVIAEPKMETPTSPPVHYDPAGNVVADVEVQALIDAGVTVTAKYPEGSLVRWREIPETAALRAIKANAK